MVMRDALLEICVKVMTKEFGDLPEDVMDKLNCTDKCNIELAIEKLVMKGTLKEITDIL